MKLTGNNSRPPPISLLSQSLPKRDVSVTSVNPSISDMMLQRRERRNGPNSDIFSSMDTSTIRLRSGLSLSRDLSNSLGMRSSRKKSSCARNPVAFPASLSSGTMTSAANCHATATYANLRLHRSFHVLAAWSIEAKLYKRQELVQRLVLWRPSSKTAGQVISAVLNGQAPVKRFDGRNKDVLSLTARRAEAYAQMSSPTNGNSTCSLRRLLNALRASRRVGL